MAWFSWSSAVRRVRCLTEDGQGKWKPEKEKGNAAQESSSRLGSERKGFCSRAECGSGGRGQAKVGRKKTGCREVSFQHFQAEEQSIHTDIIESPKLQLAYL